MKLYPRHRETETTTKGEEDVVRRKRERDQRHHQLGEGNTRQAKKLRQLFSKQ
jgi:hypothetical protein